MIRLTLQALRPMIAAALRGAEPLIPTERADVFEGIALITRQGDQDMSKQAEAVAAALREAEAMRLQFCNQFDETPTQSV